MIKHETELRLKPSDLDPGEVIADEGKLRGREHRHEIPHRYHKGQPDGCRTDQGNQTLRQPFSQNAVENGAEERQHGNQPEQFQWIHLHHFNKLLRSTFNDSRFRNIAITKARPTAASAAATTRTKKTKIWPLIWPCWLENATKVRFTAFNMISTDNSSAMMFRLMKNPSTPIRNKTAPTMRYQAIGIIDPSLRKRRRPTGQSVSAAMS